jgi:CubicO group peptidase (beta-lactamase class C family)
MKEPIPMRADPDLSREQYIDKLFAAFNETPGCVVGVTRHGEAVFAKAYGMADLEHGIPLSLASSFNVGSVSKQFTAMAVLLLAEEGKISLDDSIRNAVPELPAYMDGVTLKHLLNHTSGIRNYFAVGHRAGNPPPDGYIYTDRSMLNIISRQKNLNFPPGSEYQYCNSGYVLLSIVVKRISGLNLDQYAREHIFGPLGMKATRFQHDHTSVIPNRVSGYKHEGGEWHTYNSICDTVGDGGMYSTIGDMLKWAANFDHPAVGERALHEMQLKSHLNSGEEIEYGMGLAMDCYRGLERVRHAGGHAGYRTNFERFPTEGLTVVLLCNNTTVDFFGFTRQVVEAYAGSKMVGDPLPGAPKATVPAPSPIPPTDEQLREYVGDYWNDELRAFYKFTVDNSVLFYAAGDLDPLPTYSIGIDKMRYDGFEIDFTFTRNSHGNVTGVAMEASSVRRIQFQKKLSPLDAYS